MTDDELIAEFHTRQAAGRFGDRALMFPAEADYSGMWSALCDHLPGWEARFGWDNPVLWEIRAAIREIADRRPDAVEVFRVNTTRYGREDQHGE